MTSMEIDEIATGCLLDQQNETQWRAFCDACEEMWGESDKPWELARLSAATPVAWVMNGPMEFKRPTVQSVEDRVWAIEIATAVLGKAFYLKPTMVNWERFKFACERGNVPWRAIYTGYRANFSRQTVLAMAYRYSGSSADREDSGQSWYWFQRMYEVWATILPASTKR